jgi:hypothetical protein
MAGGMLDNTKLPDESAVVVKLARQEYGCRFYSSCFRPTTPFIVPVCAVTVNVINENRPISKLYLIIIISATKVYC